MQSRCHDDPLNRDAAGPDIATLSRGSDGQVALQADAWHTDGRGYTLIAKAVFDALTTEGALRRR